MRPDNGTIEISDDPSRLKKALFVLAAFTILCGLIVFRKVGNLQTSSFMYVVICFGLVLLGLATLLAAWRVLKPAGPRLRLDSNGIWIGGSRGGITVPWNVVSGVSRVQISNKMLLVLEMSDDNYTNLNRGSAIRTVNKFNKYLGVKGIPILASGLAVSLEELERIFKEHISSGRASAPATTFAKI